MALGVEFKQHLHELMVEVADKTRDEEMAYANQLRGQAHANSSAFPIAIRDAKLHAIESCVGQTIAKYIEAVSIWGLKIDDTLEKEMVNEFWHLTAGPNQLQFPPAINGSSHAQAVNRSFAMERQRLANRLVREGANRLRELKMKTKARPESSQSTIVQGDQYINNGIAGAIGPHSINQLRESKMSDAERFILRELLSDFKQRNLQTSDLHKVYEGLTIEAMKLNASDQSIGEVDFDLALDDLTKQQLIKTGPPAIAGGESRGGVLIMPMIYSKKEYACLTDKGYKEASKSKSIPITPIQIWQPPQPNQTIIHGDQYNVEQAAAVGPHSAGTLNNQPQWIAIQNVDLEALGGELEQLRQHLVQSASTGADYAQLQVVAEAKAAAAKRDKSRVMEFLSKGGKALLDAATDFGAKVTAEVIAKQLGLS